MRPWIPFLFLLVAVAVAYYFGLTRNMTIKHGLYHGQRLTCEHGFVPLDGDYTVTSGSEGYTFWKAGRSIATCTVKHD